MSDNGNLAPQIRFKGYNNAWELCKVEDFAQVGTGNKDTQDAIADGEYDFYVRSPNIEKINSYSFDGEAVLTVGDGVGVGKVFHYVNGKFDYHQRVYKISDFDGVDGVYFYHYFAQNFIKESQKYNAKTSVDSVRRDMITKMDIPCPEILEQKSIGNFFRTLDNAILMQKRKCNSLQKLKAAYLQQMFPQTGKTVPRLRFSGFAENWQKQKLSDISEITMGQSPDSINYTDNPSDHILVQGNADMKNGLVVPRVWTTQITKTANKGDIIIGVRAPVGDVGKTDYDVVLGRGVAGMKGNEFIYQSLLKMKLFGFWERVTQGSTFESINSSDIKDATIAIPSASEQEKIGVFFQNIDNQITAHTKKLEQLKSLKVAYLQKMFI